jgi:hypothetical protein
MRSGRTPKSAPTKIGDLFEGYRKRLQAPQKSVIAVAIEVIHDLLGVSLDAKVFSYSPHTKTLSIKAPGMVKSEITLQKTEILAHMKGRLGEKSAPTTII